MARKKPALGTATPTGIPGNDEALDVGSVTALLSTEYPLVDAPLIIALLSDYDPLLDSHIDEVRSQLGIIEATLIPDTDVPEVVVHDDSEPSLDALSDNAVPDVDQKLAQLALNDPPPFAASPAQLKTSQSSKPSRSASASGSRTSSTTSPTSVSDADGGFEDDVTLLKSLFPSIDTKTLKDALVSESGVPAAIDHLLSVELIRDVEREGRWPGESDQDTDHDEPEPVHATRVELVKTLADPTLPAAPPELRRSRSKKKSKPMAVPLVDTLQRRSNTSSRPSSRQSSRASSPIRGGPSSNAWGTVASLAGYLSELIPSHPTTFFLTYMHSPKYHSAYSAVRAALANIPPTRNTATSAESPARGILEDVYGAALVNDPAARADLELCFKAVGEDVAVVMDLMDLLGEISEWPGDDDLEVAGRGLGATTPKSAPRSAPSSPRPAPKKIPQRSEPETSSEDERPHEPIVVPRPVRAAPNTERLTTRPLPMADLIPSDRVIPGAQAPPSAFSSPTAYDTFGLPSNFAAGSKRSKSKDRQIHPQNWRNVNHPRMRRAKILHPLAGSIPTYARGITPHNDTPGSLYHSTNPDINDCLSRAAAERQKREDAVRAAGRSYRLPGGKSLNGAVAGAYALQAREATERAREWELRAARMVVARQMDTSGYTIDLHHMTVHEAVTVALESAAKWYDRQKKLYDESVKVESRARGIAFVPPKGLTVVVGVGRHSAGKVGVIGPAVGNALEASGWRVDRGEGGRGYMVVRGRK